MILLFGDKATKSSSSNKNTNIKNHPVENSGILAMGYSEAKSMLSMGEYDTYVFSNPVAVDYSNYSDSEYDSNSGFDSGFMSSFSSAIATLGDCGYSAAASSYSCGVSAGGSYSAGGSCSSFSSVG